MKKSIIVTIILFFINVFIYYLAVNNVTLSDKLYSFDIQIIGVSQYQETIISTGPFYMSTNGQDKTPIKCLEKSHITSPSESKDSSSNLNDILTKKFSNQITRFCYGIKVFTVLNLLFLLLITIFPILKFFSKKAELYLLGGLILSYIINISLVGAIYNKLQNEYQKIEKDTGSIFHLKKSRLNSAYNTMIGIMIFYILMLVVKLFHYNYKIVCKK